MGLSFWMRSQEDLESPSMSEIERRLGMRDVDGDEMSNE